MQETKLEIKKGITLHKIKTQKFKTNLMAIFFTTKLNKENVTKNALISLLLRRGTATIPNQEEISKKLEEMYGCEFDSGIDKIGNNQLYKFYIETVNDEFLPQKTEELWKKQLQLILEIVLNPYNENGKFKEEYFEKEKNTLKQIIESRKDNKSRYALDRCIEEMYKNEPYGIYKYGTVEDIEKIDNKELYNFYKNLIQTCKIDIYLSGNLPEDSKIEEVLNNNENFKKLEDRNPEFTPIETEIREEKQEKTVEEKMEVQQGKLNIGLNVNIKNKEEKIPAVVYNTLLGGSANSKLFRNVREKAHLAYVAKSNYMRHKNTIFISSGIEISNYDKALKIIREQIQDMKDGKFSKEDLDEAKKVITGGLKTTYDEQDTQITYYFGQEIAEENMSIKEYMEKINKVTAEEVENVAKKVSVDTIYFLRN